MKWINFFKKRQHWFSWKLWRYALKEKRKLKIFTFVVVHFFVVTIVPIGSHHACGWLCCCLTVLMVAMMYYLNCYHCYCCYHVERILHHDHLDVSTMGWVVHFEYLVILNKKIIIPFNLNRTKNRWKWSDFLWIYHFVCAFMCIASCVVLFSPNKNRFQHKNHEPKCV